MLTYFGGPRWDDRTLPVRGRGQEALLFRLALDAGTLVGYRALAEDVWPDDPPDDARAALQSLVSRLRRALPNGLLVAGPGGYLLAVDREQVDLTRFQDLVDRARRDSDPARAADLASQALSLWRGDPWLPDGFDWTLRDLLEDRAHAERLLQNGSAIAETVAPSAPAAITALVGRRAELDMLALQIARERLVTLIGPGGAGKTTLALETARRMTDTVVVELAPATAAEVWAAVAAAIGRSVRLSESSRVESDRDRVHMGLAGRDTLVVLDNCEHVTDAAAEVAREILRFAPGVRILATSREPLGLPGEAFVVLEPLPLADARELFARRVRAARGTAPSASDSETVDRIVLRLDGLPLALELAAAKSRTLTLDEIDAGLDDRFALLARGPRAADPRHQTLRALIDWSWDTLSDPERTALLAAAVFPDGIGIPDASAVGVAFGTRADAFEQLVDRSLLNRVTGRYRMLETVREYGLDRLRSGGSTDAYRAVAASVLADLAADRDVLLRGSRVREALAWFDANEENLTSALRVAREDPALRSLGVRLLRGCFWAWAMRERFDAVRMGLIDLADPDAPLDSEPVVVINGIALVVDSFVALGDPEDPPSDEVVAEFRERALALTESARLHPSEMSLLLASMLGGAVDAIDRAGGWPRDARNLELRPPDPSAPPWTHAFAAVLRTAFAQNSGDIDALGVHSELALRMFTQLDDAWGRALATQFRSEWLMLEGRLDEALTIADASSAALAGLTSTWDQLQQRALGISILVRLGRLDEAVERLAAVEVDAEADGSARALAQYRFTAASLAVATGDGAAALRHLDAVPLDALPGPERQLLAWGAAKRAQALLLLGDTEAARAALVEAFPAAIRSGDQPILAEIVLTLAAWLVEADRPVEARAAFAAAVRLRGRLDEADPVVGRLVRSIGVPEPLSGDADLAALRALLDESALGQARRM